MKKMLLLLSVLLTCVSFPLHAADLTPGSASASAGASYLPENYQFTFTLEKPEKEPLVISFLTGGRALEFSNSSLAGPNLIIMIKQMLKENDRILVDYSIGFRVKMEGEKFIDEGIKGSVHLSIDKEVTILREPGRTIKLKFTLPRAL